MDRLEIAELFEYAAHEGVSDIFITSGSPIMLKKNGMIIPHTEERIMPELAARLVEDMFKLASPHRTDDFMGGGDRDFSVSISGVGRFRVSAFRQRGSLAAVVRVVRSSLPDSDALGIPGAVIEFANETSGLVLVTGPAGAGKTTTLATIINRINSSRNGHILTLEDPIEYLHPHGKSIVNQREVGTDTVGYARALRAGLRQSPDVIMVGEMRDLETVAIAMTAAETGTMVLSTLHTVGVANSIDRIIDVFPPEQQRQVRIQLSMILRGVVSQQLLPSPTKGRVPVFEIMKTNPAIGNLIRESKTFQLDNMIHSGAAQGMQLMDYDIARVLRAGDITEETAMAFCLNRDMVARLALS